MRQTVLAIFIVLAAPACTYGSAVDIASFEARERQAALQPGDYCEMKLGPSPKVISSEDCVRIEWDGVKRIHTMIDLSRRETGNPEPPAGEDRQEFAVVALGDDLYAAQFDDPDKPGRHELITFLAMGDAVSGVSMVEDATLRRLVAAHPNMVWEGLPPERAADEPARLISSSPLIRSASVEEIRAFLREATIAALREDRPDPDEIASVGIRDRAGVRDHAPSDAQLAAGRELLKLIETMRN